MSILFRYIYKHLKQNISSTLLSIFSIAVASSLFFFVINFGMNTINSYQQAVVNSYGNYHASFYHVSDDFLASLKLHAKVKDIKEIEIQKVIKNTNFDKPLNASIQLIGMDEACFHELGYLLQEGKYPQNHHEILISSAFIRTSKLNLNLDDSIQMENDTYKIVGILATNFLENESNHFTMITSPINAGSKNVFITYDDVQQTNELTKKISQDFKGQYTSFGINEKSLAIHSTIELTTNPLIIWIIVILILFISINILLIRNSYKNSYLNREKHLAILKTVGVTNRQCKKMMLIEGLLLLCAGLCAGLVLGFLLILVIVPNINELLYSISIESIQIGHHYFIQTSLFTILYISCISIYFIRKSTKKVLHLNVSSTLQSNDEIENCNVPYLQLNKKRNILFRLFNKNIRQNFRSYRHLMIGLTLILSLLILWNGMMGYLRDSNFFDVNDYNYDVELSFTAENYPTSFMTQLKRSEYASEVVISETLLLKSNQIEALDQDYYEQNNISQQFVLEFITYSDEVLDNFIFTNSQIKVDQLKPLYDRQHIHGIIINQMYHPALRRFYSIMNTHQLNSLTYEGTEVLSNIELIYTTSLLTGTNYQKNPQIIVTREVFDSMIQKVDKKHEYHVYFQCNDTNSLVRELNSLNDGRVDDYVVKNVIESLNYGKSMIELIRLLSYGFIISLIIMSLLAFCCLAATNFEYRQKEFVLYHVLGLRIKDMMKLVFMEVLYYLFFILLSAWAFSQVMNLLIYRLIFEKIGLHFFIPVNTFVGITVFVILAVIGFMGIVYIHMKSLKYSEVLKNDISLM